MSREHPGVDQSIGTDDSDGATNRSTQLQVETDFHGGDQMSQSSGIEMQSPNVKPDLNLCITDALTHRRLSQVTRLRPSDSYPHTQPPTPNMPHLATWQVTADVRRQSHRHDPRSSRFPIHVKTPGELQYNDLGPMSAPINHTQYRYRGTHSVPQSASFVPTDFAAAYYHDGSDAASVNYNPSGFMDGQIHPPMVLSRVASQDDAGRIQQSQIKGEDLGPHLPEVTTMAQAPQIYAYTTQEYQEPVNLGIATDLNHYQLPGPGFMGWDVPDEDKYQDTFGEPTPGQLVSQYTF